jgi:peroxiredoxin
LADTSLNVPAPNFSLKDLDGKTVSLSDYKGKVLVLDFWATWCVPCRDSFPATQLVMDKYKNDANVAFLFIDTRETSEDSKDLIRTFLAENHYPFKVIMDEKGANGVQNLIYKKYVMPGIPTKYIIDSKGIIRFQSVGFNPDITDGEVVKEMSTMIESTRTHS